MMEPSTSFTNKRPRRVLVTGGLGFVGYHLCNALLDFHPECELTIVDNLSSTQLDYSSLLGRAEIHITDLRNYTPGNSRFDDIYHLASPVGSLAILERHGNIASDILQLSHIASQLAARDNAALLYLSSSEVYGRDGQHNEKADQIVPDRHGTRMEYALGKLTAEHVLFNLADAATHSIRIVRPFNVVGRFQSEALGFVIPAFYKSALTGSPLMVHGDGLQTRSFCDVDDLIQGLLSVQHSGSASTVYNVGNPKNLTSIIELAKAITVLCKSSSSIELIDPQKRYGSHYLEAYNKIPDIERVTQDTGWVPHKNLSDILHNLHLFYHQEAQDLLLAGKSRNKDRLFEKQAQV